ncbi:hypothetical protein [Terriglobus sp. RCC_193]|uniref:hypothetical protein n=1 Tax=Terriglobus sp. RCC_193 TaxID=3239218 RepID=UPI0035248F26
METAAQGAAIYSHRKNPDATFDSICHRCFSTVATESSEAALAKHEQQHECGALSQARALMHKDGYMSERFVRASIHAA